MNNNKYASNFDVSIVTFLLCALISGCSSLSPKVVERTTYQPIHTHQAQFIQTYIDSMTDSLIVSDHFYNTKKGRVAVGSIGMINTLKLSDDETHPLNLLGLTLQDGLMTSLLNRGYLVVEYHRSKNIIIRDNQDLMLTRELEYLKKDQALNYFLTGTIAYQENGASVSLRIIDLENDQISAATTKFIPINVFWSNQGVTSYNGKLYRNNSSTGSH